MFRAPHTRAAIVAVALCALAACDRPATTSPDPGFTATAQTPRQTLRGTVRRLEEIWALELQGGSVIQLAGASDELLVPFEGKEVVVVGILRAGIMTVESCGPAVPTEPEYSRRR